VLLAIMLQSTSRSHSLAANFQEVLSLMKSHNSKLCAGPSSHSRVARRGTGFQTLRRTTSARSCDHHKPCTEMVTESLDELTSLILQLEDEFSQLSMYVPITLLFFYDKFSFANVMRAAKVVKTVNSRVADLNSVFRSSPRR